MLFSQSKQKYGFVLGHCPLLSKAEIEKVLESLKVDYQVIFFNEKVLIIEVTGKLNIEKVQERLGGTVKISCIVYCVSQNDLKEEINILTIKRLKDLKTKKKKFQFGFSVYGKADAKDLEKIGLLIKRQLKEQGVKSRYIVSKESSLSSVIIQKEKLLKQGADIVIVSSDNQYYIGYTVSVQKFEDYSLRDYGRPTRDDKSGMLPPKLAKMMLNLSQADYHQIILDPFCGSGTVIQEALLLGYKNIIGSDVSRQAVEFTRNNLEWLKTKYNLDISNVQIHNVDVGNLSSKIQFQSISTIITEPYLGPSEKVKKPQRVITELTKLYLSAFEEFYKVLKKDGKVVIIFPIINGKQIDILNDIKRMGFSIESLGKEPRRSITYSRPGQRVLREIFVFYKHG